MNARRRLPSRRPSHIETLEVGGQVFTACVGFDPKSGRPRELFLDAPKPDSMFGAMLADVATIVSISLQYGVPAAALAKSVGRLPDLPVLPADLDQNTAGSHPASAIGAAVDLLCQFERDQWVTSQEAIPPSGTPLGGLSGGPVFMMQQLHYPLVGVITEFHDAFEDLEVLRVQGIAHLPILRDIAASD